MPTQAYASSPVEERLGVVGYFREKKKAANNSVAFIITNLTSVIKILGVPLDIRAQAPPS